MNITLLINYDCASILALSHLKSGLDKHNIRVFYTQKPQAPSVTTSALSELADFDRGIVRQHEQLLKSINAELMNDINGKDFGRFCASDPDLVISIRHMSILKEKVIATPEFGVINLHSGPLPKYQGVMATFWGMKNKDSSIGTTLHLIEDSKIDSGAIIATSVKPARYHKSYFWNTLNLYEDGCSTVMSAVESLDQGQTLNALPHQGRANYYTYPTEMDFAEFNYKLFEQSDSLIEFLS